MKTEKNTTTFIFSFLLMLASPLLISGCTVSMDLIEEGVIRFSNFSSTWSQASQQFDSSGNFYLADIRNGVIRQISSTSGNITTVAGSIGQISDGVGGPTSVTIVGNGDIYIADPQDAVIRKISASSGLMSIVAGNGYSGYSGDGGLAVNAQLQSPMAMAFDSAGNMYIADNGNNVIREIIAATGIITTVVGDGNSGYIGDGGPAITAELSYPQSVRIDGLGNMYIADWGNNVIRKVDTSGVISTFAGNGTGGYSGDGGPATAAELNEPFDIAIDSSNNIYVADDGNSVIREILFSNNNITTIAGDGNYGYSGDGGLATNAELGSPDGINFDNSGNLYISDSGNSVIRKIATLSGNISTVVGDGNCGYSGDQGPATTAEICGPEGLAFDSSGNYYFADVDSPAVRKVATNGIITSFADATGDNFPGINASFSYPQASVIDSLGNLYICNSNYSVIQKVSAQTGIISLVAGVPYYTGYNGDGGSATAAILNYPQGLVLDIYGNLYIADTQNEVIRKVSVATGIISTVAGNGTSGYSGDGGLATSAQLNNPQSVTVDMSGNLYIADEYNNVIRKVDATTGLISTIAGNGTSAYSGDGGLATLASLNYPAGVWVDQNGNIYIADTSNNVIREVSATTGFISTIAGVASSFGYSGDGGSATMAQFNYPTSVTMDKSNNYYATDFQNNVIRKINVSTGVISTFAGDGTGGYSGDGGLATNAEIYFYSNIPVSDMRFKKNIETIPNSLKKILQVRGVTFDWRSEEFPGRRFKQTRDMGVIAQEVEKVFPEVVQTAPDGYKSVNYQVLVAPLIEAVKELYHKYLEQDESIQSQAKDIASLKQENAQLHLENATIKKENAEIKAQLKSIKDKLEIK